MVKVADQEATAKTAPTEQEVVIPVTLPAGKTLFSVTTDGNDELLAVIGLNGKTPEQGFAYFEKKFESETPPTGPAEGAIVANLHDFEKGETILFELDLTAGPLLFLCQLEGENEGDKKHEEKLTITVT